MVNCFNKFKRKIINILDLDNDKYYENHKNKDGICYGLYGGTKSTDYLAEHCIGCKHHSLFLIRKVESRMTKQEQEVINTLPRLCDGGTCLQVIQMVDELDTLREKLSKIEQIVKDYDGTLPSMISQFSEIQKVLE